MKNLIQLGALAFVVSLTVTACGDGDKGKDKGGDTTSTASSTKVIDTVKKDTSGTVLAVKKDSTVTTKTEEKK